MCFLEFRKRWTAQISEKKLCLVMDSPFKLNTVSLSKDIGFS